MGRLLDIAETVPLVDSPVMERTVNQQKQLDHPEYRTEGRRQIRPADEPGKDYKPGKEYSQPAADVLDLLARAGAPLLHTALVQGLAGRGYGKAAACKAIADVQGQGWIGHNLVSGYVLAGSEE